MALHVGVNVVEVDGRASPALQAAPTSVGAFLGLTERGVPGEAVQVLGLDTFRERFGGHRTDSFTAHALDGFFGNGGGEARVVRIVGSGSIASSRTLNDRQGTPGTTLRLTAGYRGRPDPGPWGDRVRVDVRDDPRGRTRLLGAALTNTATSATLESPAGIRVGSIVRFFDSAGPTTAFVTVTSVGPGTQIAWTGGIGAGFAVATTDVTTAEFRLVVRYRAGATAELQVVEDWRSLSMDATSADYVVARLGHPGTGSRYLVATDLSGTAPVGLELPAVVSDAALSGGVEAAPGAADYVGTAAAHTGLFALDTASVQLLAIPDAHRLVVGARQAVVRGALDYCANRGDCMFVGAPPDRTTAGGGVARALSDYTELESSYLTRILAESAPFQAAKVYGALYAPWIRVMDPSGAGPAPARFVPPDGHTMGVYARTDRERGVWKAPAGTAAIVRGALEAAATFTDEQHTTLVRTGFVNGIRPTPGAGIVVAASRTLSTDPRWWYVNVRLLFNFVKASLRDGLRFVRQEPHSEELRRMVRFNVVTPFLLGLWRRGAFGSDPADMVFTVKCDAENNPPAEVQLGNFRVEVYFYPVRPAETIVIVVGQQDSGATAADA
jgi:hypothetical protein